MNDNGRSPTTQSILKAAAGIAALAAIAFGASAIASNGKSTSASVAGAPPGMAQQGGGPPQGGPGGPGGPGFGTPVTGATAAKVKAAALAKYPGTIEHIEQSPNGGYVAHVIRSSGEVHVFVSKTFEVTGVETGPPGGGRPPQQAPSAADGASS